MTGPVDREKTVPTKTAESFALRSQPTKSGSTVVPDDHTIARFSLNRCTAKTPTKWSDPAHVVAVFGFMSTDGGATWNVLGHFNDRGGVVINIDKASGAQFEGDISAVTLPLPAGQNRLLRMVVVTLDGTPADVDGAIETA